MKIDAGGGGAGRAKKPSGSFCLTREVNCSAGMQSPFEFRSFSVFFFEFARSSNAFPLIKCVNGFYCVQGMCLSEALRLVVILERAALEKGRPDLGH